MSQFEREPWFHRTLSEQPALLVSALYLFASVIGLFYSWAFMRPFGINMLQYAEISDFLLASIKEPLTWVLALFSVVLIQLDNFVSRRVQARKPTRGFRWYSSWYGTEGYRRLNHLMIVVMAALFLFAYASLKEDSVRDGEADVYEVQFADGLPAEPRVLLGTTVNFIFLYDPSSERASIHPNESVLSLSKRVPGEPVGKPTVPVDSKPDSPDADRAPADTVGPEPKPKASKGSSSTNADQPTTGAEGESL